jgi:hypothetical protein
MLIMAPGEGWLRRTGAVIGSSTPMARQSRWTGPHRATGRLRQPSGPHDTLCSPQPVMSEYVYGPMSPA